MADEGPGTGGTGGDEAVVLQYQGVVIGSQRRDQALLFAVIKDDALIANVMGMREFFRQDSIDRQNKPTDRERWGMTPQRVNAYYNSSFNEIVFPAAILQAPFFDLRFFFSLAHLLQVADQVGGLDVTDDGNGFQSHIFVCMSQHILKNFIKFGSIAVSNQIQ